MHDHFSDEDLDEDLGALEEEQELDGEDDGLKENPIGDQGDEDDQALACGECDGDVSAEDELCPWCGAEFSDEDTDEGAEDDED